MQEMVIDSIRVSLMNYQRVVILKDKNSDRYLPIWIGHSEADSIAVRLQEVTVPRPLTHDLLSSVISEMGGSVSYILVSDLTDDTFFAKIGIDKGSEIVEIDSRPSDAIALAVRVSAPIYAEESVLERAGVDFDSDTGEAIIPSSLGQFGKENSGLKEGELERLSAFKDFIGNLDLEDFERRQ